MIRMASVDQAIALLAEHGGACMTPVVQLPLAQAAGLRLAASVIAAVDQPPADVSAMDGYAVQFADMRGASPLTIIGQSRAGLPFTGSVAPGEAVRIFTGAWLPPGADHVLIQEDAKRDGDSLRVTAQQIGPANIRRLGRDFRAGAELIPAGHVITPGAIALAAAGNIASLSVHAAPRVGLLANGDELTAPGSRLSPGQVVNSIAPALALLVARWGAIPIDLGVAGDDEADVRRCIAAAHDGQVDVVIAIGGASVGDYDVVRAAFATAGYAPVFEKIAVKPGKPTWFSRADRTLALGLPGNPAAAFVTAQLFLQPLLAALTGAAPAPIASSAAASVRAFPATGNRDEYLRAVLTIGPDAQARIAPAEDQDSSLLSPFLAANALIRRPANAPAVKAGERVDILRLT